MALAGALAGLLFGNVGAFPKTYGIPLRKGVSSAEVLAANGTVDSSETGPSQVSASAGSYAANGEPLKLPSALAIDAAKGEPFKLPNTLVAYAAKGGRLYSRWLVE